MRSVSDTAMHNNPGYIRFLLGASWAGNVVLTTLAIYLAINHQGPLSPLTFFTIAFCLLLGNLLPISVYVINTWWRQIEIKGERAIATETLRVTLDKASEISERLNGLHVDAAKSVIIARQVPDRIDEKLNQLAALKGSSNRDDLKPVLDQLAELHVLIAAANSKPIEDCADQKRLNDVFLAVASIQSRLDELSAEIKESVSVATEPVRRQLEDLELELTQTKLAQPEIHPIVEISSAVEKVELNVTESALSPQPDAPKPTIEPEVEKKIIPVTGQPDSVAEAAQPPEEHLEPEQVSEPHHPTKRSRRAHKEEEGVVELFPNKEWLPKVDKVGADEVVLVMKAMIGVSNKLYLRGDPPLLDWEAGIEPDMTGIGEWRWSAKGVVEPLKCKVLLNDKTWAGGGDIMLIPGKLVRIEPHF